MASCTWCGASTNSIPLSIRDDFGVDIADVGMNDPPFDDNGEVPEGQAQLVQRVDE